MQNIKSLMFENFSRLAHHLWVKGSIIQAFEA